VGVGVGAGTPAATGEPSPVALPPPHAQSAEATRKASRFFLIGNMGEPPHHIV
jgi:hypothetical protein